MTDPSVWTSATPLSNTDFRRLLETPRPEGHRPRSSATPKQTPKRQPPKQTQDDKPRKPPPKPKTQEEINEDENAYRDRAKERREGISADYLRIEEELQHVLHGKGLGNDLSKITIQDSKFLGGDLEHTHLVKGLDYALLQKERMKLAKQMEEDAKNKTRGPEIRVRKEDMEVKTPLARSIIDTIFNPPKREVRDLFQPRRMAFVYDFGEDMLDTDIPTTLRRSKADCPSTSEAVLAGVDGGVLERIAKIMSYMKLGASGKPGKKLKKKEKEELLLGLATQGPVGDQPVITKIPSGLNAQAKAAKAAVDDGGDIFGDSGTDYKPAPPPKANKADTAKKSDTYFHKKDDMHDIQVGTIREVDMDVEEGEVPPPPPPPPPPPSGNGSYGNYGYGADAQAYGYDGAYYRAAPQPPAPGPGGYVDPQAYEAYLQANIQYQASLDPEYQALLAKQAALRSEEEEPQASGRPAAEGDAARWKDGEKNKAPKGFSDDAYAECYPEYHTVMTEVVDDDDEDLTKMDSRTKGKSRYDFQTEEEWQKYKEQSEAMPKAAFQFGVKMTDGRKSGKGGEGKQKNQKLNTDLHKIERLLKDKGYDHGGAFRKEDRTPTQFDPSISTPSRKRQRI